MYSRHTIGVACLAVSCSFSPTSVVAAGFYDNEDALRLRLRNELRRADRPSAGDAHNIYAWVQAFELEYNSGYLGDIIGADIGNFYVQRLDTKEDWSTRWYLDGNESFNRHTAAVKLKITDSLKVKVGRMVTDSPYSGQNDIPIINSSSQRAVPTLSDAVLAQYHVNKNFDIYGMYRYGHYRYSDVEGGVHKAGPISPETLSYEDFRPQYVLSGGYHDQFRSYALSIASQQDVANQIMAKTMTKHATGDSYGGVIKPELLAFYAKLQGQSLQHSGARSTYVLGGQLTYDNTYGSVFVGLGKTGPKTNRLAGLDTDIGYVFDLSIDRNHSDMWSSQIGATWKFYPGAFVGVAQVYTNGYEDYTDRVRIKGHATNFMLGYTPQDGVLKGIKSLLVLNTAREQREGSALGNHLDYFDIKMTIQYDFNIR